MRRFFKNLFGTKTPTIRRRSSPTRLGMEEAMRTAPDNANRVALASAYVFTQQLEKALAQHPDAARNGSQCLLGHATPCHRKACQFAENGSTMKPARNAASVHIG